MAILGTTLLLSVGKVSVSYAQEQRTGPAASETASEKHTPSSKTDEPPEANAVSKASEGTLKGLAGRFASDQREIWTSPARLRFSDTQWLVPLSGITAGLFVTDRDFSKHLSQNPTTITHYKTLSNAGVAALVGGAGGMWVMGHVSHNQHWSETGFLAGEAALNSLVAVEGLKYSLRRERPYQGNGSGSFFQSGGTSFPSEHAAAAWSVAGVIAHEYPGPFTKILAYGLASLVDISRVRAQQHFPSDVVVGAVIGNLVAQNIYSRHHDSGLGGGEWRSISQMFRGDGSLSAANQGSPYVPLDSWIYPAFDRLIALGYAKSAILGMRPWTRLECARLLSEAGDRIMEIKSGSEAEKTYQLLETEFLDELEGKGGDGRFRGRVESVYTRVTAISGEPLTDGNHFGQTLINDFGRPYQEGFNSVDGFSAWTTAGRWVGYVRGEYQHSPSAPALPDGARQFIASVDNTPGVPPAAPFSAVNRVRLLDAYVGMNFENWQVSFGKQSLWWGPSESGPLMFTDNAVPVNMFRINRVSPFKLPSILGFMGPIRIEFILGQLSGHDFVSSEAAGQFGEWGRSLNPQPFVDGIKLNFKPTQNFEFGIDYTTTFGGPGVPLTFHTFLKSMIGLGNGPVGSSSDPGDRRSGVDFSYRIPKLRNWLTFYGDAFTEDEFSPLNYPRKAAIQGGIYMPRVPGVPKLDLRLEGGSTVPADFPNCFGCFYVNSRFPDGSYMSAGNLLGSWLGRAGQGERLGAHIGSARATRFNSITATRK